MYWFTTWLQAIWDHKCTRDCIKSEITWFCVLILEVAQQPFLTNDLRRDKTHLDRAADTLSSPAVGSPHAEHIQAGALHVPAIPQWLWYQGIVLSCYSELLWVLLLEHGSGETAVMSPHHMRVINYRSQSTLTPQWNTAYHNLSTPLFPIQWGTLSCLYRNYRLRDQ